jgi:hypothetical protein|tara:strand:+ start:299 stop:406 length:108 start_codon:yes stop_codon:yes gene_type:complete
MIETPQLGRLTEDELTYLLYLERKNKKGKKWRCDY